MQRTEIYTPIICNIAVRCTFPAFINFSTTNILRLCRFLFLIYRAYTILYFNSNIIQIK